MNEALNLGAPQAQTVEYTKAGLSSAGQAGGQQIAPGGRLLIEHFTRTKHAGQLLQHQVRVERLEEHAPCTADRFIKRTGSQQGDRQSLDHCRQRFRMVDLIFGEQLMQHGGFDAVQMEPAFQMA